jgi:hypothetical protein
MSVVFNVRGIAIAAMAFGAAYGFQHLLPGWLPESATLAVAIGLAVGLDLTVRVSRGEAKFFDPEQGGNALFLPVWLVGVLSLGTMAYQHLAPDPVDATADAVPASAVVSARD